MSALVDRITAVLRKADILPATCGQSRPTAERYHRMAAAVAAEIQSEQDRQLTEAWQAGFNEGMKRR